MSITTFHPGLFDTTFFDDCLFDTRGLVLVSETVLVSDPELSAPLIGVTLHLSDGVNIKEYTIQVRVKRLRETLWESIYNLLTWGAGLWGQVSSTSSTFSKDTTTPASTWTKTASTSFSWTKSSSASKPTWET